MLPYLFTIIIFSHGLIHLMGFAKAFGYGNFTQLTKEIPKSAGCLWLITSILFIVTAMLFMFNVERWPVVAIVAVIISQVMIITVWKDAKFGTVANIIVLLIAIPAIAGIILIKW